MAEHASAARPVQIRDAELADIGSMATLFPRAFYPVNQTLYSRAFPDTPAVRQHFWHPFFAREVQESRCRPLVALDSRAVDSSRIVVGLICLRLMGPDEPGIGSWSHQPMLPEQDAALFQPAFRGMEYWRTHLFKDSGRSHYLVQLFGVDHAYRGTGVGKRLLQAACDVADGAGLDMFVQANSGAKSFYEKFGFVDQATVALQVDGQPDYLEHHLVRWADS